MIETHLNMFDAVVLGIMGLSCLFAFFRGLVREILSLAAWIGAGMITIYYFPMVDEKLKIHFKNPAVAAGAAAIGLYIGALICFALINMFILKAIKRGGDGGMLDNVLGLGFGALRGALIVSLGYFLLTVALPENAHPEWLKSSITKPYVEKGAIMLANVAPNYLREISSLQKKAMDNMNAPDEKEPSDDADKATASESAGNGYSRQSNQKLNRLINSSGAGQ